MSSPIDRFIDSIRVAESRQQREIVLTLAQARDLHADITRVLLQLAATPPSDSVITIEMKGADFRSEP